MWFRSLATQMMQIPTLPLKDGNAVPMLGIGTGTAWYKDGPDDPLNLQLVELLKAALAQGYVHVDTADSYGTEREVGLAIQQSGIPREKLFITTKVQDGWQNVPAALDASLEKLQLKYVDWSIGSSNFQKHHIETLLETCTIKPVLNQLEFHPYLQRANDFVPWMREHGIEVSSFKTLVPITVGKGGSLDELLPSLAAKYGVAKSVILLSWCIEQNIPPITTTSSLSRLEEYRTATEEVLEPVDVEEISQAGFKHHFRWWGKNFFEPNDRS
ncbi:hypothetical protein MKX08_000631 [Trichoderma sp. CBMAI-0020]|nr:hypothetical protein MKX08_000631 [Trichoderma sp. CBMAI-0020]